MELVGGFDDIITGSLDVDGGVTLVAGLLDLIAAVGDDRYFAGLNFCSCARRVGAVPVPRD
jgi:hypothetical protein